MVTRVVKRLRRSLSTNWVHSAFVFGSGATNSRSKEIDVCIILKPAERFQSFLDGLAHVLFAVQPVVTGFSIYPTMELRSFSVDLSRRRVHLLIYPDYSTYVRCESQGLRENIAKSHLLITGTRPIAKSKKGTASAISTSHWDILLKVINSLVLLLNEKSRYSRKQQAHATSVYQYCCHWLFQKQPSLSSGKTLEDIIIEYCQLSKESK